ncbi:hypothetical protein AYK26_07790 [Euryarchaeota archaeon SM23-78]|nr:MAG: hypothetical protein AYK26_07790 [Euryarchaeota archaeon SM23-78]
MNFSDKTILITGGTGSFGSNFIRHFLKLHTPKRIRIYSRDEHEQDALLNNSPYSGILDGFIGDVRDSVRLHRAMEGVDIVLHAAALKKVQSCEYNPFETIKTNILGSMNVVDAALDMEVEKVLAISTDKAVHPLNLYGATKMCMEKLMVNANSYRGKKKTKICCIRYGNVAGSRGSVIPIWKELLRKGEVIPISNVLATRFWIDMEEAIDFVIDCLGLMDYNYGGEIFIPKLPSFKLKDLFDAIRSSNTQFTIIGNRIGDKLHETLVSSSEMEHTMDAADKYIIYPYEPKWEYHNPKGVKCSGRNAYTSDSNNWFLTVSEIKEKFQKII